jgi:hypothetical protein
MIVTVITVIIKVARWAVPERFFSYMAAHDASPIIGTAFNESQIVACRKSRSVPKCDIFAFASSTRIATGMKQDHRNMTTNTLVTGTESTAANKEKIAIALILCSYNSGVLDIRDCGVKVVPFWPETTMLDLTLNTVVLLHHAHIHVEHQYGLPACQCLLLRGCHVFKANVAREA